MQSLKILLLLCALVVSSLFAQEIRKYDVLIIKRSRSKLEGKVIVKGDQVIFISKDGSSQMTFKRDEVIIRFANTAKDVYLQRSKLLKIRDSKGRLELAQFCLKYDLLQEAKTELCRSIASAPTEKSAYQILSNLYAQERAKLLENGAYKAKDLQGLFNREMALYLLAEKNKIQDPLLLYRSAEVYQYLQIFPSALERLQKAIQLAGADPPAQLKREGQILLAEIELALHHWEKALKILEDQGDGKDFPFLLRYRLMLARGLGNFQLGKLDESAKFYQETKTTISAKEFESKKIEPSIYLGALYFIQGGEKLKKSEAEFLEALELLGTTDLVKRVSVLANLSLVCSLQGKVKSGEKYLKESLELYKKLKVESLVKKDSNLYLAEAYLQRASKNRKKACQLYEKAAEAHGHSGFLFFLAGKNYGEIRDYSRAERCLQKAVQYKFNPQDCLFELARLALANHKEEKALRYLRYITENMEKAKFFSGFSKADVFYYLGLVYLNQKKIPMAQKAFQKALQQNPNHIHSLNGLGYIYYSQARSLSGKEQFYTLQLAKTQLKKVLSLDPKNSYAPNLLSHISSTTKLKMWEDTFQRPDSPRPYNQWNTRAKGGIDIRLAGKKLVFKGEQTTQGERTSAFRTVEAKGFVKFEVTFSGKNFTDGKTDKDKTEGGILIEALRNDSLGKLRLFATSEGIFYFFEQAGQGGMAKPEKLAPLPLSKEFTFSLALIDEKKSLLQLGINHTLFKNLTGPSFFRADRFNLEVYGQAEEKVKWGLSVSRVRIFKKR